MLRHRHRRLRRKEIKKRRIMIVVSMFAVTFLFASGYAAFQTVIRINVKGNIIQTINALGLKATVVTSGDGLYRDSVETDRYIYKGLNPNNYIKFNGNELWRIYSIESDGSMKIIKNESLGNIVWDPGYSTPSIEGIKSFGSIVGTRFTNANTDYCYQYEANESEYRGCSSWGNKNTTLNENEENVFSRPINSISTETLYTLPDGEAYINIYLNHQFNNSTYKGLNNTKTEYEELTLPNYYLINSDYTAYIKLGIWNIGIPDTWSGTSNIETIIRREKSYKWKGKVALISVSEYMRASLDSSCSNVSIFNEQSSPCNNYNYLYKNQDSFWTISANSQNGALPVRRLGDMSGGYNYYQKGTYPMLFLISNIKLVGSGTSSNPYHILGTP